MGLLGELKRRNVIRMAGLYLVGAWLVVQVASTLLPVFEAPPWVLKTLVGLLALGFVPALVFSWLYELTPEGLKRDAEVTAEQSIASATGRRMDGLIVTGLVLLVALTLANRYFPSVGAPAPRAATTSTAPATAPKASTSAAIPSATPSIAVLPFVNLSADPENQYFSDGITEELLNVLVHVDDIGVASRTSSFAYRGKDIGVAAIAKELKVDHILEGSVRKSGNRVRITAQLIDAVHDRQIWSETYDRELTDIFEIQDEIANAIVTALKGSLGGTRTVTVRADTENLDAYQLYLKARELFVTRSDVAESIRLSEQVVKMDPQFARGWETLAAAYGVAPSWLPHDRDYLALTKQAAGRALELDPSLSMPYAALALAQQYSGPNNWSEILALCDKAIVADPKNATAHLWRATYWNNLGFFERALADTDECLRIDPAYQNCKRWKAMALQLMGKSGEALALFEEGVHAGFITNRADSFIPLLVERGDRIGARVLLDRLGVKSELAGLLMQALSAPTPTPPNAGELVARDLPASDQGVAFRLGHVRALVWLGAYDLVPAASDNNSDEMVAWDRYPPSFRGSAGFKKTLEQLNVPAFWREHGYPPQCRAIGETDFTCE